MKSKILLRDRWYEIKQELKQLSDYLDYASPEYHDYEDATERQEKLQEEKEFIESTIDLYESYE